jgi:hypothetical protein
LDEIDCSSEEAIAAAEEEAGDFLAVLYIAFVCMAKRHPRKDFRELAKWLTEKSWMFERRREIDARLRQQMERRH